MAKRTLLGLFCLCVALTGVTVLSCVKRNVTGLPCNSDVIGCPNGDAWVVDNGSFSLRPRFVITFPEIRLTTPKEFCFRCNGLPEVPLTFALAFPGATAQEALERVANTEVECRISDDKGEMILSARGALRKWKLSHAPADSGLTEFWMPEARDLRFKRSNAYNVVVIVENTDGTGDIRLEPTLKGGGHELP